MNRTIAVFNKAQKHVFSGIKTIRERLPFPLLGYDSNGGSEFINDQLYRCSIQEKITFTRGRSGKKNDNAFVEEKNDSIVRRWVRYGRYDTQEQVNILNELHEVLRLYTNFFLLVMKLSHKEFDFDEDPKIEKDQMYYAMRESTSAPTGGYDVFYI